MKESNMIDFIEAEKYLDARRNKKYFIPEADSKFKLTKEDIENIKNLQSKFGNSEVEKIFCPSTIPGARFIVESECGECKKFYDKIATKTALFEYLKSDQKHLNSLCSLYLCNECQEENQKILRQGNSPEEIHQRKIGQTEDFINNFLDPGKEWDVGVKCWEKFQALGYYIHSLYFEVISNHIKSMKYSDFLKTPYWKAIAEKKMQQSGFKCQLCNENGKLNVHHRTYATHGEEISNMQDLIVLCAPCHAKFHGKEN